MLLFRVNEFAKQSSNEPKISFTKISSRVFYAKSSNLANCGGIIGYLASSPLSTVRLKISLYDLFSDFVPKEDP